MRGIGLFYSKHEMQIVWLTVFVLLLVRIFYIFMYGNFDKTTFADAAGYNDYAKTVISDATWLVRADFPASFREPVYPLFVAAVYGVFGSESFLAVYLIQALISSLMLLLIYRIAVRTLNSKLVGYLSMIWGGFYIFYLRWVGELLRETVTCFLVALLFYLLILFLKRNTTNIRHLMLSSLVYCLLIHTDGRYLFYAPFLIIPFLFYSKPLGLAIKRYIIFGFFIFLLTVPWTIRNYIAYGDLIIVSPYTLNLTGSEVSARNELFSTAKIETAGYSLHFNTFNVNYPSETERDSVITGFNPRGRTAMELIAIRKGRRAASSFIGRKLYFLKKMWLPFNYGGYYAPFPMAYFEEGYSRGHNLISIIQYGTLLPFTLLALVSFFVNRMKSAWLLILPIVIHFLLHLVSFGIERYRHPIDVFLIILGCYGIIWFLLYINTLRLKQLTKITRMS